MAAVVQAYRRGPPPRRWEPVEPWQILSAAPMSKTDVAAWGADGARVLAWFHQGDLRHAWPVAAQPAPSAAPLRGLAALVSRLRRLWAPLPGALELASAEP